MKLNATLTLLVAAAAEAHYTFPAIVVNGKQSADWEHTRKTANYQSNGPVTDVTSQAFRCYQLANGNEGATTASVAAGSTLGYIAKSTVSHPGPMAVYMAKVPTGQTAASWNGDGKSWFKIYQDYPTVSGNGLTWVTQGKSQVNIPIPKCLADGEYLVRIEHTALHSASSVGGAQIYISCSQVSITGGTGTLSPKNLVSFPGAFPQNDPGLVVNIYYPVPTNYRPPGPDPEKC